MLLWYSDVDTDFDTHFGLGSDSPCNGKCTLWNVNILTTPDIEYMDEMLRSKCLLAPLSLLFRSRHIQLDTSVFPLHKYNYVKASVVR